MESVGQRLACHWCQAQNPPDRTTCLVCGAPLSVADVVSDSGWREAPKLRDMTEINFGQGSTCQVEGEIVPIAELKLSQGDAVFFEHHILLWKDEELAISSMSLPGGIKRLFGGMPFRVTVGQGPGRLALSRDATGEIVVMPLLPGVELDVREHAFLMSSHTVTYSFIQIQGLANILHGGQGMYMDRFVTQQYPGIVLLHGYGNVLERTLKPGESLLVEPGAFLYKDSSVTMQAERQKIQGGGMFGGGQGMYMARMTGPGRVGIQSMYVHAD
ncbi:MAG: AIM24 family protein [Candidatus Dormibacteria bacterium]